MNGPAVLPVNRGPAVFEGGSGLGAWAAQGLFLPPRHPQPGSLQLQVPLLFWLAEHLRPGTYVNLGLHGSTAHLSVCQAVQALSLGTRCYGMGSSIEALPLQLREQHDLLYSSFSKLLPAACDDDGLQHFRCASIDWLQVDGIAELEQLQANWRSWRRRLSNRALLTVHQSRAARASPLGGWLARLQKCHSWAEFTHGEGMLVIAVGAEQGPAIQQLFATMQDEFSGRWLREFFDRLGQAFEQACDASSSPSLPQAGQRVPALGTATSRTRPGGDGEQQAMDAAALAAQCEAAGRAARRTGDEVKALMQRMREAEAQVQAVEQGLQQARAELREQNGRLEERFRELGRLSQQFEEHAHALLSVRDQSRRDRP